MKTLIGTWLAFTLIPFASLVYETSSAADIRDAYLGSWGTGDEAGMSILGGLKITATSISIEGSRSSPNCHTTYKVVDRSEGPHPSPDEGWPFSEVPTELTYTTVKIQLKVKKCLGTAAFFRFAVPSNTRDHLDVVLYNSENRPAGWFAFYRRE